MYALLSFCTLPSIHLYTIHLYPIHLYTIYPLFIRTLPNTPHMVGLVPYLTFWGNLLASYKMVYIFVPIMCTLCKADAYRQQTLNPYVKSHSLAQIGR